MVEWKRLEEMDLYGRCVGGSCRGRWKAGGRGVNL